MKVKITITDADYDDTNWQNNHGHSLVCRAVVRKYEVGATYINSYSYQKDMLVIWETKNPKKRTFPHREWIFEYSKSLKKDMDWGRVEVGKSYFVDLKLSMITSVDSQNEIIT